MVDKQLERGKFSVENEMTRVVSEQNRDRGRERVPK